MKTSPFLLRTNVHLSDRKKRREIMIRHAAASARIEGVKNAGKRAVAAASKSSRSSATPR